MNKTRGGHVSIYNPCVGESEDQSICIIIILYILYTLYFCFILFLSTVGISIWYCNAHYEESNCHLHDSWMGKSWLKNIFDLPSPVWVYACMVLLMPAFIIASCGRRDAIQHHHVDCSWLLIKIKYACICSHIINSYYESFIATTHFLNHLLRVYHQLTCCLPFYYDGNCLNYYMIAIIMAKMYLVVKAAVFTFTH